MEVPFVVDEHKWKSKAGKTPVYKVLFKNSDGHSLTLVGNSREILDRFPKDETVSVKISRTQQTLDEIPDEAE